MPGHHAAWETPKADNQPMLSIHTNLLERPSCLACYHSERVEKGFASWRIIVFWQLLGRYVSEVSYHNSYVASHRN